jgi:hypothetical protein
MGLVMVPYVGGQIADIVDGLHAFPITQVMNHL